VYLKCSLRRVLFPSVCNSMLTTMLLQKPDTWPCVLLPYPLLAALL
jgi:hypothetical protein